MNIVPKYPKDKMENSYEWRTGRSCKYTLNYHLVFITKYRRDIFTHSMLNRLEEVFTETCLQMDGELFEFNGEDDHVHLLLTIPPKIAISNFISKLKGKSSYYLRREFAKELAQKLWGKHLWTPSYCLVSCGGAPLDIIKQYIEDQRRPPSAWGVHVANRHKKIKLHGEA